MEAGYKSATHSAHTRKITSLRRSISTSSLLFFRSTSLNRWQSPGLMCPLLCRHHAKMQTHCETSLAVLIWVRLTRACRFFTREDMAISFPGVNLHGTFIGFLGCVYFLFMSWWKPREKVSVSLSVLEITVSPHWLTCELTVRRSKVGSRVFPSHLSCLVSYKLQAYCTWWSRFSTLFRLPVVSELLKI